MPRRQVLMDRQLQNVTAQELRIRAHLMSAWLRAVVPELERINAARTKLLCRGLFVGHDHREEKRTDSVRNRRERLKNVRAQERRKPAIVLDALLPDGGIVEPLQETFRQPRHGQIDLVEVETD